MLLFDDELIKDPVTVSNVVDSGYFSYSVVFFYLLNLVF